MFAPSANVYKSFSSGQWNDLRIVAKGDMVEHWLNGTKVVSFQYHSPAWWNAYDRSKWTAYRGYCMKVPGNRNGGFIDQGYLGFQGNHGGKWLIRSLRVNAETGKVNLGPEKTTGCTIGLDAARAGTRPLFSIERSRNAVTLRLADARADAVSLLGLDGREAARARVQDGSATLAGYGRPGIYLLRAEGGGRTVLHQKVLLP
jgi:hypothetical protein